MVFVFHFGFCQRGAIVNTPVHWFQSAIDVAFLEEIDEGSGDGSFVAMVHCEIGLIPLAEDAEPLEFHFVLLDEARGELPAHPTEFSGVDFGGLSAKLFFDLGLDR